MTETMQLLESYLDAIAARDFAAVRGCLSDVEFRQVSPIAQFDDPDEFVSSLEAIGAILHKVNIIRRFQDDEVVCHVLDLIVNLDTRRTRRIVHLARVLQGKIIDIEVIFDASEFNRMIITGDQWPF